MSLLPVVGQTLVIYLFLIVLLGRVGRSLMAGLTHFDYLIVALLGSAVETGLYCGSNALSAGLASSTTLLLADHATSFLMNRWPRLRRLLAGTSVVLVHNGQLIPAHLRQVRLTEDDVRAAIRGRGYDSLNAVYLAVIEPNGEIGVVPVRRSDRS
jgi:uncharacterized membrane protein YcaP (DUF421 family)